MPGSLLDFQDRVRQSTGWAQYTQQQKLALAGDYVKSQGLDPQGPEARMITEMAGGAVQGMQDDRGFAVAARQGLRGSLLGAGLNQAGLVGKEEDPGILDSAADVLSGRAFQGVSLRDTALSASQAQLSSGIAAAAAIPEGLAGNLAGRVLGGAAAKLATPVVEGLEGAFSAGSRAATPLEARAAQALADAGGRIGAARTAGNIAGNVAVNAASGGIVALQDTGDVGAALRGAALGATLGLVLDPAAIAPAARAARRAITRRPTTPDGAEPPVAGPLSAGLAAQARGEAPAAPAASAPAPTGLPPLAQNADELVVPKLTHATPAQVAATLADKLPEVLTPAKLNELLQKNPDAAALYVLDNNLGAYVRADLHAQMQADAARLGGSTVTPVTQGLPEYTGPKVEEDLPVPDQQEVVPSFDENLLKLLGLRNETRELLGAEAAPEMAPGTRSLLGFDDAPEPKPEPFAPRLDEIQLMEQMERERAAEAAEARAENAARLADEYAPGPRPPSIDDRVNAFNAESDARIEARRQKEADERAAWMDAEKSRADEPVNPWQEAQTLMDAAMAAKEATARLNAAQAPLTRPRGIEESPSGVAPSEERFPQFPGGVPPRRPPKPVRQDGPSEAQQQSDVEIAAMRAEAEKRKASPQYQEAAKAEQIAKLQSQLAELNAALKSKANKDPSQKEALLAVINLIEDDLRALGVKVKKRAQRRPKAQSPDKTGLAALISDESGEYRVGAATDAALAAARGVARAVGYAGEALNALGRPLSRGVEYLEGVVNQSERLDKLEDAFLDWAGKSNVGKFLVTDAGISRDVRQAFETADRIAGTAVSPLREALGKMSNLTLDQRKDVYNHIAEGDKLVDQSLVPLVQEIQAAVDGIRKKMLELEQLSPELYEKRKGNYLPRQFQDTYLEALKQAVSGTAAAVRGKPIKGTKQRGVNRIVGRDEFLDFSRPWRKMSEQGDQVTVSDGVETRTLPREGADELLADWYTDLADDQVRALGEGDTLIARQDWTRGERDQMKEIRDVTVAADKMARDARKEIAKGAVFKQIASLPGYTKSFSDLGLTKPPAHGTRADGFVYFSGENANSGSGGSKWGALGNKFVREDIAEQLLAQDQFADFIKAMDTVKTVTLVKAAKQSQTVLSQRYYFTNFIGNAVPYYVYGGQTGNIPVAARMLLDRDPLVKRMEADGIIRAGQINQDIGAQVLDNISLPGGVSMIAKLWDTAVKTGGKGAQFIDDTFRVGIVKSAMDKGIPYEQAIKRARELYDPTRIKSAGSEMAEALWNPYAKFSLWAVQSVPRMAMNRPVSTLAGIGLIGYGLDYANKLAGLDTEEKRQGSQERLPAYARNPKIIGTDIDVPFAQKTVPLPVKDSLGQRLDFGIAAAMPWASSFSQVPTEGANANVPNALRPGTPITTIAAALLGVNPSTGRTLAEPSRDTRARYIAEYFLPQALGRDAFRLYDWFVGGTPNFNDRSRDPYTLLAGSLGVKLDPRNTEREIQFKTKQTKAKVRELKSELLNQARLVKELGGTSGQSAALARLESLRGAYNGRVKAYMADLERARK